MHQDPIEFHSLLLEPQLKICSALVSFFLAFASGSCLAADIPTDEIAFTSYVANEVKKEVGSTDVVVKSPLTLSVGSLQANLDRIFAFCKSNSRQCPNEISTYVKAVSEVSKERNTPIAKESIRLIIRTSQYVEASRNQSVEVQATPLVPGLEIIVALDTPRAIRPIVQTDNKALGLTPIEVFELGKSNLISSLKPLMEVAKVTTTGQIGQVGGDSYQSSRLALLESWEPLAKAHGGVLIVAVPATDLVVFVGEDSPRAIDALRAIVKNVISRAPNRLSDLLLRWSSTGWQVVK